MKRPPINFVSLVLMSIAILAIGFAGGWLFTWERYVQVMLERQTMNEVILSELYMQKGTIWALMNFAAYQDAVKYDGQVLTKLMDAVEGYTLDTAGGQQ